MKRAFLGAALVILAGGCGGDDEQASTGTTATEPVTLTAPGRVYWLREGKVWPAARDIETPAVASAALGPLFEGPTEQETELGLSTAIPDGIEGADVSIDDGLAVVQLDVQLLDEALGQIVYTLTQFPTVERVEIHERIVTRADFEDETPAILVKSPLSFEEVTSPLRATGTANTFEANFQYELTDTDGRIIAEHFVTATSGTGTRGTFEFSVPFAFEGEGTLIVFESSAEDGSRINVAEIPLRLTQ